MIGIVAAFVLTAGLVAEATGGRLVSGEPDRAFASVSIDSRALAPGSLFIALRGERFDGHAFVDAAVREGAVGLLVERAPAGSAAPADLATVVVPDTLAALQALGRDARRRSGARVVAITGSSGKTSTKEMTADVLAARYSVFRNAGNLNNHIGLPLSLVELRHGPDVGVVELGMNHAGEIRALVGIAEPDVRVWTNVGDAHVGFFGSREAIARAKAEILEGPPTPATLVANADDPLVARHTAGWAGRRISFGEAAAADVRATDVRDRGVEGTAATVRTPAGAIALRVPLPGRGQLSNALAAVAVGLALDVPLDRIPPRIAGTKPVGRRGALVTLARGVRLLDDSYNASPVAVRMMLDALAATPGEARRVAVLGEMLELGDASRALHRECGAAAVRAGVTQLVAIGGPDADGYVEGAEAAGLSPDRVHRFADSATAADAVAGLVAPGDLVLIKGSRATRTDRVADRLQEAG